MKAFESRKLL